jgi:hypothetical protein
MGQTATGARKTEADAAASSAAPEAPRGGSDIAQQAIQQIAPAMGKRGRFAGDVLADAIGAPSLAAASATSKYSPETVSKAPSSQYLAAGASPARLSGF